ncbi:MAG: alkaline shock response membrane anchor protein AmaP [Actinobacteria bacterium]|nr:alkaline shock response membrane anchor protein AmaP [Actinomycetota bacterium]
MTALRRAGQVVGILVIMALGTVLMLEGTDVIGATWRREIADGFDDGALPELADWATALVGAGLALTGVLLLLAQLMPPKRGVRKMHEVHHTDDGDTHIRGRAVIHAVRHVLEEIDGVAAVDARWAGKRVNAEVQVDDSANVAAVEGQARAALGHGFWINLGLADVGFNLLMTHKAARPPGSQRR